MNARVFALTLLAAGPGFGQPAFDPTGTWEWRCCDNRNSGTFVIDRLERDGTFRGKFGNSASDAGTPFSGRMSGAMMEFTRSIGAEVQRWAGTITADGKQASGTCSGYGLTSPQTFRATRSTVPTDARALAPLTAGATANGTITAQNGPYSSTWRQRGSSSTWDAVWSEPSTITTVMEATT